MLQASRLSPAVDNASTERLPQGFTLIEIMVVIAIIGTLSLLVGPSLFRHIGDARMASARTQIESFVLALESYRIDVGQYPSTEQNLAALRVQPSNSAAGWRGPYLRREIPLDPWNRPYSFISPGVINPESYDLVSFGRDGIAGGVNEDADMTSWSARSASSQ